MGPDVSKPGKMGKYGILQCPKWGPKKGVKCVKMWSHRGLQREFVHGEDREKVSKSSHFNKTVKKC